MPSSATNPTTLEDEVCMTRARPATTDLPTYGPTFDAMCAAASIHWRTTLPAPPDDAPVVVVDVLMQDLRLALRTLTLANSLRRLQPSRLVALIGPNRHWHERIWDGYDRERLLQLARAYGADVIDVGDVAERIATGSSVVELLGRDLDVAPPAEGSHRDRLRVTADSTAMRILRVPRLRDATAQDDVPGITRTVDAEDRLYRTLFGRQPVLAFVTSHVDYGQWGLAVDAATANDGVPVIHAQATGGLKAYALFPAAQGADCGFRRALTLQIAQQYEDQVWPHRDALRPSAERTAWRSKANLGRPSWWRGGGEISRLDLRSTDEREALRGYTLERLGLDTDRPVVTVFNHAVSDAIQGNHEAFADLATWLEQTVEAASRDETASWLFLDHPSQINYDRTEHFERLAAACADRPHLVFRPSLAQPERAVERHRPGRDRPRQRQRRVPGLRHTALCRPAGRSGATSGSAGEPTPPRTTSTRSGVSARPRRRRPTHHRRAGRGGPGCGCGSTESGADVTTPLVPHWENGQGTALHQLVTTAMNHVEDDSDPAYVALRRLWERRDPVLTRMDLGLDSEGLAVLTRCRTTSPRPARVAGLGTAHDDLAARGTRHPRVSSGLDPSVRGWSRGSCAAAPSSGA